MKKSQAGVRSEERRRTIVHGMAIGEQQELVQLLVEARGGLMDGGDNRAAARCQLTQRGDQVHGRGGVQARGGLIQEDDGGVDQQLVADRDSLALAPADAPPEEAACSEKDPQSCVSAHGNGHAAMCMQAVHVVHRRSGASSRLQDQHCSWNHDAPPDKAACCEKYPHRTTDLGTSSGPAQH